MKGSQIWGSSKSRVLCSLMVYTIPPKLLLAVSHLTYYYLRPLSGCIFDPVPSGCTVEVLVQYQCG